MINRIRNARILRFLIRHKIDFTLIINIKVLKQRIALFLRPGRSTEMQILRDEVYKMTKARLIKYWVRRVNSGEIPSKPSVTPTAKSARARVLKVPTALTVVMLDEVPEGVRVITIDGKKPGDEGYRLNLETGEDASNP